ncbi:MAG: hypothetical protein GF317_06085 [Candidatus Lokiarchaeota archaeon]|nr:hypothetical protein [Candidatus Lokiarchaeota archaeon]
MVHRSKEKKQLQIYVLKKIIDLGRDPLIKINFSRIAEYAFLSRIYETIEILYEEAEEKGIDIKDIAELERKATKIELNLIGRRMKNSRG